MIKNHFNHRLAGVQQQVKRTCDGLNAEGFEL